MPLARLPEPFDDPDWIFEVKYDGFRCLAHVGRDVRLVSRYGHEFGGFNPARSALREIDRTAVIDGELAVLDGAGRSVFDHLLFRRAEPTFCAFDLLWLDGHDYRQMALV
jgi:bifunctional non-homologous end joining protein LigD